MADCGHNMFMIVMNIFLVSIHLVFVKEHIGGFK